MTHPLAFGVTVRCAAILVAASLLASCSSTADLSASRVVVDPAPIEAGIAPPPGPYAPGFDALHYDVRLALPDTGSFIEGEMRGRFALITPSPDTLSLDLTGLAVSGVNADGSPAAFRYEAGKLHVPVPEGADLGDTLDVLVRYSGHPADGLILGQNLHGTPTAFADNWPDRARFWFPSIDHPSDKATARFQVRLSPATGRRVISNGVLEGSDDGSVWTWTNHEPIPTYTMVIGAADFEVATVGRACVGGACTDVTTWLYPPDAVRGAASFRRAAEMVEYYVELIAPFPYAKLAHVQSATRFGGMENASAIFYSEQAISEGRDIEKTVAHETAHQWFGDAVTEADWHHLWLSEGFAEYFAVLFFEHADGRAALEALMADSRQAYLQSGDAEEPVVNPDEQNLFGLLNTNNYYKGAWVLHMLRNLLGDDVFFEGIRTYYRRHVHGTALTDDLRRAFETASSRDLTSFFDQWIHRPGHPKLALEWEFADGTARVDVRQVQSGAWPVFDFPLELAFETSDGTVRRSVQIDARDESVEFDLPSPPSALLADPAVRLLAEIVTVTRRSR